MEKDIDGGKENQEDINEDNEICCGEEKEEAIDSGKYKQKEMDGSI